MRKSIPTKSQSTIAMKGTFTKSGWVTGTAQLHHPAETAADSTVQLIAPRKRHAHAIWGKRFRENRVPSHHAK
jgi:hypothetical protein